MDVAVHPVDELFCLKPSDPLDRMLTKGFHPCEKDDTGAFRWTAPAGRIRLPAAPGGETYRLRLDLAYRGMGPASNRVEIVAGDRRESFWVDNETRTYEMTVAEPSLSNGWVVASIEAAPWTPADYGSRDSRTLGVRWYGVQWERVKEEGGR